MIDIDNAGHNAFGDISTTKHFAPLVVNVNHITALDSAFGCINGMHPDRLIQISIRSSNFTGHDLMEPVDVIHLSMNAPARMVGNHQQGIILSPFAGESLIVEIAFFYPVRHRRPLQIIREGLSQPLGIKLQLAAGGRHWSFHRIVVKLDHTGRNLLPVRVGRYDIVFLFLEFFPGT